MVPFCLFGGVLEELTFSWDFSLTGVLKCRMLWFSFSFFFFFKFILFLLLFLLLLLFYLFPEWHISSLTSPLKSSWGKALQVGSEPFGLFDFISLGALTNASGHAPPRGPNLGESLVLLHALAFINTISIIAIRIHYSQQKDKAGNTYLWIEFLSALSWDCFILELFAVYILPSSRKKGKPCNGKTVWVREMPWDDLSGMLNRWGDLWDPRSSHSHSTAQTANFIFFKHKSYLVSPCWRLFIIAIRQL